MLVTVLSPALASNCNVSEGGVILGPFDGKYAEWPRHTRLLRGWA